jgi:hypothetical protein
VSYNCALDIDTALLVVTTVVPHRAYGLGSVSPLRMSLGCGFFGVRGLAGAGAGLVKRRLPSRMFLVSEPEQGGREASGGRVCGRGSGGQC